MKPQVLVVDDEESIRFTFERFLTLADHGVSTAADYDQALQQLDRSRYDLIYSDIILGGKTGIDLLKAVKERNITAPVVVITGYPNVETAAEALRLGAFDYISKPVQKETLLRTTDRALSFKRVVDERERYRANLEAILRSVRDAIVTVDNDLVVTGVNKAAASVCGITDSAVGRPFSSLALCFSEEFRAALRETVLTKEPVEMQRLECRTPSCAPRAVAVYTSPLLDAQGATSGAVLVVRDDTRLATLEEELAERHEFQNIVGKSPGMQKIYSLIETLADVETTVLITGESGTGKELVAEALHYRGARRQRPLVKVNCSALSENLLESELFGHVRGAFTGALSDKIGRFQKANTGTIFLDEIADVSPRMQSSLLRVLQEKEFERVGESAPIKVDVRVITATNQNLLQKVKRGEFREDLYYRLKVVELHLPPLRERREDIPLLADHFLRIYNKKFRKAIGSLSGEVMQLFMRHPWPGNVRELSHSLEHAFVLCNHSTVGLEDLPLDVRAADPGVSPEAPDGTEPGFQTPSLLKGTVLDNERQVIVGALRKTGGNKAKAARLLGVSQRTIFRKIKEYEIRDEECYEGP